MRTERYQHNFSGDIKKDTDSLIHAALKVLLRHHPALMIIYSSHASQALEVAFNKRLAFSFGGSLLAVYSLSGILAVTDHRDCDPG